MYLVGHDRFDEFAFSIPEDVVTYCELVRYFPFLRDVRSKQVILHLGEGRYVHASPAFLVEIGDMLWYGDYTIETSVNKPLTARV